MIKRLFLKYIDFIGTRKISENYWDRERKELQFNFFYADRFLRIFTYLWLVYQVFVFIELRERPAEIFSPVDYFPKVFMSGFPSVWYFGLIVGATIVTNTISLINSRLIFNKAILVFCIMWISNLRWSYGFLSNVGHCFILTHLFCLFIPARRSENSEEDSSHSRIIQLLYLGVLVVYSISGIWKVGGLVYKLALQPDVINWLHPQAALVNSISGYRYWDNHPGILLYAFEFPIIWQVLFVITLYLQLISFSASIRLPLLYWIGLGNIIFHFHNTIFMRTEFYVTPLILAILFFPYHLLLKGGKEIPYLQFKTEEAYTEKGAVYRRTYENGSAEVFSGFFAFREKSRDQKKWYYGLLYFPGLEIAGKAWLIIQGQLLKRNIVAR